MNYALLVVLLLYQSAHSEVHKIRNADELISFSESVNRGTSYSGTTVLLEDDIYFSAKQSRKFIPIGKDSGKPFSGKFDGQGHTINNLAMKITAGYLSFFQRLSNKYFGLFGYSDGAVIKNIVIDPSCSFVNADSSGYAYTGSIIGKCTSITRPCMIENNVNMAKITFEGKASFWGHVGGIVGHLLTGKYPNSLMNCVNYGTVTYSGKSGKWGEIGGIAGYVGTAYGYSNKKSQIRNCLNYGSIIYKCSSGLSNIGGIAGKSYYALFDSCVNAGEILLNKTSKYIGAIVGETFGKNSFTRCYWSEDIKYDLVGYSLKNNILSDVYSFDPDTLILNTPTDNKKSLIEELNAANRNAALGYFHWISNKDNLAISFTSGDRKNGPTINSKVVLFPEAVNGRDLFLSSCKDSRCYLHPVNTFKEKDAIDVSWMFDVYTIMFDFDNGIIVRIKYHFNEFITYPSDPERKGYTFNGWDKNITTMPAEDIVIKAVWVANNYTVTFDFDNGNTAPYTFSFNERITYPSDPVKEGYTFNGWDKNITTMPAGNIAINAVWRINNYTVTFDFDNGTTASDMFSFNEGIAYPSDPERKGYTFDGWDKEITTMPAEDIVIKAMWIKKDIITILSEIFHISFFLDLMSFKIALFSVTIIIFSWLKKGKALSYLKSTDGNSSISEDENSISLSSSSSTSSPTSGTSRISRGNVEPSKRNATGKTRSNPNTHRTQNPTKPSIKDDFIRTGFREDDATAMTTCLCGPDEDNSVKKGHKATDKSLTGNQNVNVLVSRDESSKEVTRTTGETLCRGAGNEVNLNKDSSHKDNEEAQNLLSSSSSDKNETKDNLLCEQIEG